jgi:osmotically-inducible protein OsmY
MKYLKNITAIVGIAVLMTAAGCASTGTRTGQYVDDSVITSKVKAAIFNEPQLKSAEINVETFKGQVQLSGFVSSQANVMTAMDIARNVSGVISVKDDMRLK